MKRKLAVVLGTIALLAANEVLMEGARAQSGAAPAAGGSSTPKKTEEQFKNIQVLKGIPADQLVPGMQFIAASLGVECQFCHVEGAFDKDDKKPKETARKMMAMMFAINKDNFDGHRDVTCYSCHRGSSLPVAIPVVMGNEQTTVMAEARAAETGEVKPSTEPTDNNLID
jgi:hypothetical protein